MCSCDGDIDNTGEFYGTWDAQSVCAQGTTYTIEELEVLGDFSFSGFRIVIKKTGKAYVYSAKDGGAMVDWVYENEEFLIGDINCYIDDGMLCVENNGTVLILEKTSDSQVFKAPNGYENNNSQTPPADDGDNTPPADDGDNTPPADDGDDTPPVDDGDDTPPVDDGDDTPPVDDGDDTPPVDDGDNTPPADDGDNTPPADDGDNTPPADDGDNTPPADDGDNTPPVDDGDDTPPVDDGDDTPPVDDGDDTPPLEEDEGVDAKQQAATALIELVETVAEIQKEEENHYLSPVNAWSYLYYDYDFCEEEIEYAFQTVEIDWYDQARRCVNGLFDSSWSTEQDIRAWLVFEEFSYDVINTVIDEIDWDQRAREYVKYLTEYYEDFNRFEALWMLEDVVATEEGIMILLEQCDIDWNYHATCKAYYIWLEYDEANWESEEEMLESIENELVDLWMFTPEEARYAMENCDFS